MLSALFGPLQENLRQLCVFQMAKDAGKAYLWCAACMGVSLSGLAGLRGCARCICGDPSLSTALSTSQHFPSSSFRWDYVTKFGEQCDMERKKYGQECAEHVFAQASWAAQRIRLPWVFVYG